jgi:hypothetical protein
LLQYFLLVLADDRLMLEIPFFGFKSLKYMLCVCACPCVCVCVSVRARVENCGTPKETPCFPWNRNHVALGLARRIGHFYPSTIYAKIHF